MKKTEIKKRALAFEHAFDAMILTDAHGVITDWNKASESLFGHKKTAAIGQNISLVHVPEDSEKVTLAVISSVSKQGTWSGKIKYLHKDGSIGSVESKCIAMYDDDDQIIATLGVNRDVSHIKNK